MESKLIFKRGCLELWRIIYGRYHRPSLTIIGPDIELDFPAFNNPDNGRDALNKFKKLRIKFNV